MYEVHNLTKKADTFIAQPLDPWHAIVTCLKWRKVWPNHRIVIIFKGQPRTIWE